MKQIRLLILLLLCIVLLSGISSVRAGELTPGYLYRNTPDPDFPKTLYVGWVQKCGRYTIRLLQDPVVTKSNQHMVSDADTKYLVLRVAITNDSDEPGGWLTPDSFVLQDTYRGRSNKGYSFLGFLIFAICFYPVALIISLILDDKNNGDYESESERAEALLVYKKLLDEGAITKEEFEEKKRELLG